MHGGLNTSEAAFHQSSFSSNAVISGSFIKWMMTRFYEWTMASHKILSFIINTLIHPKRWAIQPSSANISYVKLCITIDSFIWWMSHIDVGSMKSHPYGHSMKSRFDEKPLQWKAASMKSHFTWSNDISLV
jgi:hypothetical protein